MTIAIQPSLARCILTALALTATPIHIVKAQSSPGAAAVIISPGLSGDDDTDRIQQAIDSSASTGAVRFRPGLYRLKGTLHLRGSRTYIGAGSADPRAGSVLMQTSSVPGTPIFSVEDITFSVNIIGLTFDGAPGSNAKGIASGNATALLAISAIRYNFFLTGLAECIDTPIILTRIEHNQFGVSGSPIGKMHRHIHSSHPSLEGQTNANWIIGNQFKRATGGESVLFESGAQLHIIDNRFEVNDALTTVQINGMFLIVIEGNRFEGNRGEAVMRFANSRHGSQPDKIGNYIVRLQNNYYDMQRCRQGCMPIYNSFIFGLDANVDPPGREQLSVTHVYMREESGTHFTHTDGTLAELTDKSIAALCNPQGVGFYLSITGPLSLPDYKGIELPGCK